MLSLYPIHHRPAKSIFDELRQNLDNFFVNENNWRFQVPQLGPEMVHTESDDRHTLSIDVPGFKEEEISITTEKNYLTVNGKRNNERPEAYEVIRQERGPLEFSHRRTLPTGINTLEVSASLSDGILRIVLPKEEQAKPRKINITTSSTEV